MKILRPIACLCICIAASMASGCRWSSMGQNTLGVQMFQQGRYAEAMQQFEKAKQVDPTNPDTYYNLAATYHKLGTSQNNKTLIEQAEALYNQCLDLSPNHVDCYRGLAVLLVESGRSDKGFDLLKNWATANPSLAEARVELSRLYQEFGQTKVAEQYLDEALALDPGNSKAWAAKGRMRETAGDLEQALQDYQQSLAINGLQPEVYQRVGALNVRLAEKQLASIGTKSTSTTAQAVNPPKRY
jgi:Flp pilus assembly protein TadD